MGPVGVGKSTQINLLQNYYKSNKAKTIRTYIKSNHIFAYIIIKFLNLQHTRKSFPRQNDLNIVSINRNIVKRISSFLSFLDAVSIGIKFFFTVYIPFHLGFTVLIEEGLTMSLFQYSIFFPKFRGTKPKAPFFLPNLIGWIFKQKHMDIILDAEENELIRRRKNRHYRRYESPQYVRLQREWLKRLNYGKTIFIETTNLSSIQTHKVIVAAIEKLTC
jgi:hypothetical protein